MRSPCLTNAKLLSVASDGSRHLLFSEGRWTLLDVFIGQLSNVDGAGYIGRAGSLSFRIVDENVLECWHTERLPSSTWKCRDWFAGVTWISCDGGRLTYRHTDRQRVLYGLIHQFKRASGSIIHSNISILPTNQRDIMSYYRVVFRW